MRFSMAPDSGRVNRVSKLIVNPDTGPIDCCWSDCWNKARSSWTIRFHEHPRTIRCDSPFAQHANMTFCSQQHADYFAWSTGWRAHETAARNGGRILGMAPEGSHVRVTHERPKPSEPPRTKIYIPRVGFM